MLEAFKAQAKMGLRPPLSLRPERTKFFWAESTALALTSLGVGTVQFFLANHVIAYGRAIVADTDQADIGFPRLTIRDLYAIVYAGDFRDCANGKQGVSGSETPLRGAREPSPTHPFLCLISARRFSTSHLSSPTSYFLPSNPKMLVCSKAAFSDSTGNPGQEASQFSGI